MSDLCTILGKHANLYDQSTHPLWTYLPMRQGFENAWIFSEFVLNHPSLKCKWGFWPQTPEICVRLLLALEFLNSQWQWSTPVGLLFLQTFPKKLFGKNELSIISWDTAPSKTQRTILLLSGVFLFIRTFRCCWEGVHNMVHVKFLNHIMWSNYNISTNLDFSEIAEGPISRNLSYQLWGPRPCELMIFFRWTSSITLEK